MPPVAPRVRPTRRSNAPSGYVKLSVVAAKRSRHARHDIVHVYIYMYTIYIYIYIYIYARTHIHTTWCVRTEGFKRFQRLPLWLACFTENRSLATNPSDCYWANATRAGKPSFLLAVAHAPRGGFDRFWPVPCHPETWNSATYNRLLRARQERTRRLATLTFWAWGCC